MKNKHFSIKIKLTRNSQLNKFNDRKNSLNDILETYNTKPFKRNDAIEFLDDMKSDFHIPNIIRPSIATKQKDYGDPISMFSWGGPCNNSNCLSCEKLENAGETLLRRLVEERILLMLRTWPWIAKRKT